MEVKYCRGDKVRVNTGPLKYLTGVVIAEGKGIVKFRPDHEDIKENIELSV